MSTFYITTAIDYPNGAPHMGHAYEKVVSDAYARWHRFLGDETYFLTGTDENGQKLVKAAQDAKKPTQAYVDENVVLFRKLCSDLLISNDDFIRTTEERHKKIAQELWKRIEAKGDIYFGEYTGLYCLACEAFYTETQSPDRQCPTHQTNLQEVKEAGYFFKLSRYAEWISNHIRNDKHFVSPASVRNEMLGRLDREPIHDLSISRPNAGWGIPVPSNDKFVMYTWFDALINYYSAVAGGENEKFWPASMHVIGKDITWFHTVIWGAMLRSADLPLPKQVYVHGMVLGQDGRKMSKSLNNGVDPNDVIKTYPVDSFRYYLLRAIPSGGDGAFVTADLVARHNSELANDFGNLLMRVVKLCIKKMGSQVSTAGVKAEFDFGDLGERMKALMQERDHHRALEALWAEINKVNLYVTANEPWKHSGDSAEFKQIIVNALYGLHCFGGLISPFMPTIGPEVLKSLGTQCQGLESLKFGAVSFDLKDPPALFPKFETGTAKA